MSDLPLERGDRQTKFAPCLRVVKTFAAPQPVFSQRSSHVDEALRLARPSHWVTSTVKDMPYEIGQGMSKAFAPAVDHIQRRTEANGTGASLRHGRRMWLIVFEGQLFDSHDSIPCVPAGVKLLRMR